MINKKAKERFLYYTFLLRFNSTLKRSNFNKMKLPSKAKMLQKFTGKNRAQKNILQMRFPPKTATDGTESCFAHETIMGLFGCFVN